MWINFIPNHCTDSITIFCRYFVHGISILTQFLSLKIFFDVVRYIKLASVSILEAKSLHI